MGQDQTRISADVLVIGGGPAGCWAALTAAREGAKVVLADKGYCGTSGATAPSGTGVWYVEPDPQERVEAMKSREELGGYLADREWMRRVLDRTYANVSEIAAWGYPFPLDEAGRSYRKSLSGPTYMRLMRRHVQKAGVRILDHSPALELLADTHGVAGAAGVHKQTRTAWRVEASAVVIATGGCAFLSKALGTDVLTGDGYLMAAEAGAEMSGMEFSTAYSIAPAFSPVTKSAFYKWATFYREDGTIIEGAGAQRGRSVIARTLIDQPVYACLDKNVDEQTRKGMRLFQPNFFLSFDRAGIDPFTDRFPITLRFEGTVRGTGGIHIVNEQCATGVPGLYAAGDASTRELICGGFTGGGSHNSAWAMSSGYWSGEAAAKYAKTLGGQGLSRSAKGLAEQTDIPLSAGRKGGTAYGEIVQAVQREVLPYDRNWFRTGEGLKQSIGRLDDLWKQLKHGVHSGEADISRARESVAMAATARWMYASGLERKETRGMHRREEFPELDPLQQDRLISGGLDQVWVKPLSEGAGR
ncbi:FAD-binding protein [Paenibacillus hodogayensis]|uniref:FAD-binding protein n=1 Tax=Paenibacillus hodogayensis TaxID=279208 RepID=A0ABV5VRB8_9BACL